MLDIYLGYFWIKLEIEEKNRKLALGSRFTPGSLKQMKTDLANVMTYLWKRKEKLTDARLFPFFQSIYDGKRLKYNKVPQLEVEGDRKRKLIMPGDLEVMDAWMLQDPRKVETPKHLMLMVGNIFLQLDAARGTSVLRQIRRSYIRRMSDRLTGNPYYKVKGLVCRKTSGRTSKPMDFVVSGEHEVYVIQTLLEVLPRQDCDYCINANPPVPRSQDDKCTCDHIFLQERDLATWRPHQEVWFKKWAWSKDRVESLISELCYLSKTDNVHTNGDIRVTVITSYAMAKLTPDQIAQFSKSSPAQQEKYKRLGELMSPDQVRQATALVSASGREALRGRENKFGSLARAGSKEVVLFDNFARILETYDEAFDNEVGIL